ncbi:unnamed protein product [Fraxinus pennsylvanica]|uniref:Nucleoporin autopeptidase n=1 Tax=Fraxinus pennsylvanica TaxID=56036 RepID=A0AAD2DYM7_9LAMI|nr:unnamed protein product [Fraxinus pennsylvanica]
MFGSNPFGQSSSTFGSQPGFGQASNASSNPFAPKPFGSTSPFGSQTGGSIFGGTSTGVFGAQSSSPLGSTSVFGASSSPAFGSSMPAFGASSTPAFGSSSSAFGAFGSNLFGSSTPFGTPSQPAFSATSTPAFGATSAPSFGATSTPAFGSTTSPTFGATGSGFGASSSPGFGSTTPAFGASSSTPAFGASSTPAFGAASTPNFSFGSSPAFGSSPFGSTASAFGAQAAPFGAQATTPTFGSSGFGQSAFGGQQRGGTRVATYTPTPEVDGGSGTQPAGKLESISAMPVYKDKSHEELRWEDYQLGDKGGPAPSSQSTSAGGFGSSGFGSSSTPAFGQSSANPFSSSTTSNPFASKTPAFGSSGFGASSAPSFSSSPFGASTTSNLYGSSSSSIFGSTPAFGASTSPSLFGSSSSSAFGSSTSIFGSSLAQGTTPSFGSGLNFGNTQPSTPFQSAVPSLGQTSSAFGQTTSAFGQTTPAFGQSNLFSTPSTGFGGNTFSSTPSLLNTSNSVGFGQTTPSLSMPFQPSQPTQSSGGLGFGNFGQLQTASANVSGGTSSIFGQGTFGQPSGTQSSAIAQSALATNPFGTLPAMPQISIGRTGTSPSIQYGISSLPVVDKPVPIRISSLLTSRHLSQRRIRLPARKYHPKNDGPKVPFFSDDEETPSTPKAGALYIPRENPRSLVIRPLEQWSSRASAEKKPPSPKATPVHENGKIREDVPTPTNGYITENKDEDGVLNGLAKEQGHSVNLKQNANGVHDGLSELGDSYITLTGHRAGEAAIVYEHGADVEALMPKLRHSDYYTEPRIQELAAKERAEPGFCRHVKDFVVGRHGFGSIKFFGETDVRRLDLESLVQFNNREVIVYMDETKKPPIGQGLNKPAEVTLLNIKCFDKKTGEQYTEGLRIEKYKELLKRKAEDQGAEFVSYNPVKGEWKFRVNHFSEYKLGDDEE